MNLLLRIFVWYSSKNIYNFSYKDKFDPRHVTQEILSGFMTKI